jgi:uncharacterized protein (TIGR03435 family)
MMDSRNFLRQVFGGSFITMPSPGVMMMTYRGPLSEFARGLGALVAWSIGDNSPGAPIPRLRDRTGLDGIYEIHLGFSSVQPEITRADSAPAPPNIFDALVQQPGLKLQKRKRRLQFQPEKHSCHASINNSLFSLTNFSRARYRLF